MNRLFALLIAVFGVPTFAFAQVELGLYGGLQSVQPSDVAIRGPSIGSQAIVFDWEGRSSDASPYPELRATRWQSHDYDLGIDFAHNMAGAAESARLADGLTALTMTAYRRWNSLLGEATPYVTGAVHQIHDYKLANPATTFVAGASLPINDRWSVFGEYEGTYAPTSADLDNSTGLVADSVTNAVNIGVSFNF